MPHLYHLLTIVSRYRYLLLVPALLVVLTAQAQAPPWDRATPGSTALLSYFNTSTTVAMATDASGNVFVTGNFTGKVGFGSTTLTTTGGGDLFVAKYVPATNTWAWAVRGGGYYADSGTGITVSGNSVYVTGEFYNNAKNTYNVTLSSDSQGSGLTSLAGASATDSEDFLLAKYIDNGTSATLSWTQVGGGSGGETGNGVAVQGSSVYVVGSLLSDLANSRGVVFGGSGITPGTTPVPGATTTVSPDVVLLKYTDNGPSATLIWAQVSGGTEAESGGGVAVSGSSLYLTGTYVNTSSNTKAVVFGGLSTIQGTSPQAGATATLSSDIVLAKYQDNGSTATFVWSQVGGGTSYDASSGVAVSGSSVYVTGSLSNNAANLQGAVFGGSGTTAGTSSVPGASASSSEDLILAKYQDNGASGSYRWSQVGGGTDREHGYAVAASGNRVYVAGIITNSLSNSKSVVFGGPDNPTTVAGLATLVGPDLLLASYLDNGSTGRYAWAQVGGSIGSDYGYALALSGQQVYAGGSVEPPATFGALTIVVPNAQRAYTLDVLARLTDPVLTPLPTRTASLGAGLVLYPNPTRATATLTGLLPGAAVRVLDALGRMAATATADATGTATLAGLPAGLYLVQAGPGTVRLAVE